MAHKANATSYGRERGNKVPGPGVPKGNVNALYIKVMRDKAMKAKNLQRLDQALESEDDQTFLKAWAECANRGFGKPTGKMEHSGPEGKPVSVILLPPELP